MFRIRFFAVAPLVALFAGSFSVAVAVTIVGHTAPHVLKQGVTSKPVVPGTVLVQVLVSATGNATSKRILKSSNHADDAAALDVASSATYAAATKNGKPDAEYYDFSVKFNATGLAAAPAGSLASYEALSRAGKFADAKAGLTTFLAAHPDDATARLDLALADTFLDDVSDAAAAFAKVDAIPDNYKPAARKAFDEAAASDVEAKKFDEAALYAKKSIAVAPDYVAYSTLGVALMGSADNSGAVTALAKARELATGASAKERSTVDQNLTFAYLSANQPDKATAIASEEKGLDPSANVGAAFGQYYSRAGQAKESAGDFAAAATAFETGAAADPADAVTLYTNAAFDYLKMKPSNNDRAKSDADKAMAIDPADAGANYVQGIVYANAGRTSDAIASLTKADNAAKAKGETSLATQIETNLQRLGAPK